MGLSGPIVCSEAKASASLAVTISPSSIDAAVLRMEFVMDARVSCTVVIVAAEAERSQSPRGTRTAYGIPETNCTAASPRPRPRRRCGSGRTCLPTCLYQRHAGQRCSLSRQGTARCRCLRSLTSAAPTLRWSRAASMPVPNTSPSMTASGVCLKSTGACLVHLKYPS